MINFDDLSFEGFDISCYKFILVEVNKNVSLHILNSKNVLEYTILTFYLLTIVILMKLWFHTLN